MGQFTGEIHNSCFMRLGTNLTEKLRANGSKMSSRRMGSSKMAAWPVYAASVQVFNIKPHYYNTRHSMIFCTAMKSFYFQVDFIGLSVKVFVAEGLNSHDIMSIAKT